MVHHLPEGMAHFVGTGQFVPGAAPRHPVGQSPASGHQKVGRAAGGIANSQVQQGLGGRLARQASHGLDHHWLQSRIEQTLHQAIGRVVAAAGFPFVAGGGEDQELGPAGVRQIDLRFQLQQLLVNTAQFLGTQALEIDGADLARHLLTGEVAQGQQERLVGETGRIQLLGEFAVEQPTEGREVQGGGFAGLPQGAEEEQQALVEVVFIATSHGFSQATQPADRVIAVIEIPILFQSVIGKQQAPILGHQQEQQPVHQPQQLVIELPFAEVFLPQGGDQGRVEEEALAQCLESLFHPNPQVLQGPLGDTVEVLSPFLKQALGRLCARLHPEPAAMQQPPQQAERGKFASREDPLQIEAEVGLAGEADIVPQEPQFQSVGNDGIEMAG